MKKSEKGIQRALDITELSKIQAFDKMIIKKDSIANWQKKIEEVLYLGSLR